jgi:serine/threonine protein kinase/predicted Zn-dependent protease
MRQSHTEGPLCLNWNCAEVDSGELNRLSRQVESPESDFLSEGCDISSRETVHRADSVSNRTNLSFGRPSSAESLLAIACPDSLARYKIPSLPGYEILGELGRGGMGVVYKARLIRLNRIVALKMILSGVHASQEVVRRFVAEAETIAKLRHPNVIQIYAIGDHEGAPYVELEYADGGSLNSRLKGNPWEPRESARVIEAVARAIHEAHKLGVVHRDLKPANLLLTSDGCPKITDFGLAKILETDSGMTRTESVLGSPCYMAPEQAEGRSKDVGPLADVYALGANLYELLTGRPPFVASTILATLDQVRYADVVPPSRLVPAVPRDLETICLKCLQKEPAARYASALELADDLARFLRTEPIQARRASPVERLRRWAGRRTLNAVFVVSTTVTVSFSALGIYAYRESIRWRDNLARTRIANLRDQAIRSVVLGRDAFRRADWLNAKTTLESVLSQVQSEPRLQDMEPLVRAHLEECSRRLADTERERAAAAKLNRFRDRCDDLFFVQTRLAGLSDETIVREIRHQARLVLGEFGFARGTELSLDERAWNDATRGEIRSSAFTLLIILAEATLQPLAGENPAKQAEAALTVLDAAERLGDLSSFVHTYRAECLDRVGKATMAAEERAKARAWTSAKITPLDEFLLGNEALRQNDLSASVDHLVRALKLEPSHFWARYALAACQLQAGRPADARADLIACEAAKPRSRWVLLLSAIAKSRMDDFAAAERDFVESLRGNPPPDLQYVLLLNRGMARARAHKNADAYHDLQAAAALHATDTAAELALASFQSALGRSTEALETIAKALRKGPQVTSLYRLRAQIHGAMSNDAAALADLERVARIAPATDPLRFDDGMARARIHQRARRIEQALAESSAALQIRPLDSAAHKLRGSLLLVMGHAADAVACFDFCRDQGDNSPDLYEARGFALAKLGSDADAIIDLSLAIRAGRRSAFVLTRRGFCYLAIGSPRLALADFEAASINNPRFADAWYGMALAQIELHHLSDAIASTLKGRAVVSDDPRQLSLIAEAYGRISAALHANSSSCADPYPSAPEYYEQAAGTLIHRAVDQLTESDRERFLTDLVKKAPSLAALVDSACSRAVSTVR